MHVHCFKNNAYRCMHIFMHACIMFDPVNPSITPKKESNITSNNELIFSLQILIHKSFDIGFGL